jgi:hypothetical protein
VPDLCDDTPKRLLQGKHLRGLARQDLVVLLANETEEVLHNFVRHVLDLMHGGIVFELVEVAIQEAR